MSRRATQGSWCSGHSPYRCELIKLPSKAKKCYGAGLEFSEKFGQPPHYIVVKHADCRLVRGDGKKASFVIQSTLRLQTLSYADSSSYGHCFQIPILPPSQTLYLHVPAVSGHSLVSGRRGTLENEKLDFSFVYALASADNQSIN